MAISDEELLDAVSKLKVSSQDLKDIEEKIKNYRETAQKYTDLANRSQDELNQLMGHVRTEALKLRDALIEKPEPGSNDPIEVLEPERKKL